LATGEVEHLKGADLDIPSELALGLGVGVELGLVVKQVLQNEAWLLALFN
jgi:hypothetical protein